MGRDVGQLFARDLAPEGRHPAPAIADLGLPSCLPLVDVCPGEGGVDPLGDDDLLGDLGGLGQLGGLGRAAVGPATTDGSSYSSTGGAGGAGTVDRELTGLLGWGVLAR